MNAIKKIFIFLVIALSFLPNFVARADILSSADIFNLTYPKQAKLINLIIVTSFYCFVLCVSLIIIYKIRNITKNHKNKNSKINKK
jgi:hypothetical protein